jgi:hypothetical protein
MMGLPAGGVAKLLVIWLGFFLIALSLDYGAGISMGLGWSVVCGIGIGVLVAAWRH